MILRCESSASCDCRVLPGGTGAHGPLTNRRQARYFHVMEAISREGLQQTIDAEIKSLEESVRALKLRRNALSPISSLPLEVFIAIFSHLCLPGTSSSPDSGMPDSDYHLTRLRVSHVCHQWGEICTRSASLVVSSRFLHSGRCSRDTYSGQVGTLVFGGKFFWLCLGRCSVSHFPKRTPGARGLYMPPSN